MSKSIASHAVKAGNVATSGVKAAHTAALGAPPTAWGGYWTFATGVILVMFILYTAKIGTLNAWLGFLSWSAPTSVASTGATTTATTAAGAASTASTLGNYLLNGSGSGLGAGAAGAGTSVDPVAGPTGAAVAGAGSTPLPGSALGMGN